MYLQCWRTCYTTLADQIGYEDLDIRLIDHLTFTNYGNSTNSTTTRI